MLEHGPRCGAAYPHSAQTVHRWYTASSRRPTRPKEKTPPEQGFPCIGETGFEPATARPPAGCATRLRHSPWPCRAGDGNRTRPRSLEGFCATTTLRPRSLRRRIPATGKAPPLRSRARPKSSPTGFSHPGHASTSGTSRSTPPAPPPPPVSFLPRHGALRSARGLRNRPDRPAARGRTSCHAHRPGSPPIR